MSLCVNPNRPQCGAGLKHPFIQPIRWASSLCLRSTPDPLAGSRGGIMELHLLAVEGLQDQACLDQACLEPSIA